MKNTKAELFQIQVKNRGVWVDYTTTASDGQNAFLRLIARVRAGEIDPREEHFRLQPVERIGDGTFNTRPISW